MASSSSARKNTTHGSQKAPTRVKKQTTSGSTAKKKSPTAAASRKSKDTPRHAPLGRTKHIPVRPTVTKKNSPRAAAAAKRASSPAAARTGKIPVRAAGTKITTFPRKAVVTKGPRRHAVASSRKVPVRAPVMKKTSPRAAVAAHTSVTKKTSPPAPTRTRKVTGAERAKASAASTITAQRGAESVKTALKPTLSRAKADDTHARRRRHTTVFRAPSPDAKGQESSSTKRGKSYTTLQHETSAPKKCRKPLAATSKRATTLVESSSSSKLCAHSLATTRKATVTTVESLASSKTRAKSLARTSKKDAVSTDLSSSSKTRAKSSSATSTKAAAATNLSSSSKKRGASFAAASKEQTGTMLESSSPKTRAKPLAAKSKKTVATGIESSALSKNRAAATNINVAAKSVQSSSSRSRAKSLPTRSKKTTATANPSSIASKTRAKSSPTTSKEVAATTNLSSSSKKRAASLAAASKEQTGTMLESSSPKTRAKPLAAKSKIAAVTVVESSSSSKIRAKPLAATTKKAAMMAVDSSSSRRNQEKFVPAIHQNAAATLEQSSSSRRRPGKSLEAPPEQSSSSRGASTNSVTTARQKPRKRDKEVTTPSARVPEDPQTPMRSRPSPVSPSPKAKSPLRRSDRTPSPSKTAKSPSLRTTTRSRSPVASTRNRFPVASTPSPSKTAKSPSLAATTRSRSPVTSAPTPSKTAKSSSRAATTVTTSPSKTRKSVSPAAPTRSRSPGASTPSPSKTAKSSSAVASTRTPSPSKAAKSPPPAATTRSRSSVTLTPSRGRPHASRSSDATAATLLQQSAITTLSPLDSGSSEPHASVPSAIGSRLLMQVPKCESDVEKTGSKPRSRTPHRVLPRRLSVQVDARNHSPLRGKRLLFDNADGNVENPDSTPTTLKKHVDPHAGNKSNLGQEDQVMRTEEKPENVESGGTHGASHDASLVQKGLDAAAIQRSDEDEEVRKSRELLVCLQARGRESQQFDQRHPKAAASRLALGASPLKRLSPSDSTVSPTRFAGTTLTTAVATSASATVSANVADKNAFVTPPKKGSPNSNDSEIPFTARKKQRRSLGGSAVVTDNKTNTSPKTKRSSTPMRRAIPALIPFDKCRPSPFAGFVYTTHPDEWARALGQLRGNVTPPTQKKQNGSAQKKFSSTRPQTPETSSISAPSASRRAQCHHSAIDGPSGRDAPLKFVVDRGTTMSPPRVNITLPGDPSTRTSETAKVSATPVARRASCRHPGCRGLSFSRDAPPRFVVDRGTCVSPSRGWSAADPGDVLADRPSTPVANSATMSTLSSSECAKLAQSDSGVPFTRDARPSFDLDRARSLFSRQPNTSLLPMSGVVSALSPFKRLRDVTNGESGTPQSRESPVKGDAKRGTSMFSRGYDSLLLRDTWHAESRASTTHGASPQKSSDEQHACASPMSKGDLPSSPLVPTPPGVTTPPTRAFGGGSPATNNAAHRTTTPTATSPTARASTPPPSPRSYLTSTVKWKHLSLKDEASFPELLSKTADRARTAPRHTRACPNKVARKN